MSDGPRQQVKVGNVGSLVSAKLFYGQSSYETCILKGILSRL